MERFNGGKIDDLRELRSLQGEELSREEAFELAEVQREFIVSALNDGFSEYDKCFEGEKNGFFGERISDIIENYANWHIEVGSEEDQNYLLGFLAEKINLGYEEFIYDEKGVKELSDKEKLFLEFLLGLRAIDLNVRIALATVKKMVEMDAEGQYFTQDDKDKLLALSLENPGDDVISDLKKSSDVTYVLGNEMQRIFGDDAETYWLLVADAIKTDKYFEQAAKKIVSMRYIPEELEMLGIAQALHWSGWGGNGAFLEQVPKLNDPLLLRYVIGWHGGSGDAGMPHFTKRMGMFGMMINKMKEREGQNVVPVLLDHFSDVDEFKVFDGGAGPVARGSVNWIGRALAENGKKVSVTAGDVDGMSLASLASLKGKKPLEDLPDGVVIEKAVRFDANQDWPNIPNNQYYLFVMSVVLHQVMDYEKGHESIAALLSRATEATKKGGIIAWSDAGELAYIQSSVIPYNVSDREGGVPENIYDRIKFDDVAIFVGHGEDGHNYYKVPYRMSWLRYATPESLAKKYGCGIYESNVFVVLELPEYVIDQLDQVRDQPELCDAILTGYYENGVDKSVGNIAESFSGAVNKLLN